jgi:DNA adenine methylase
LVKRSESALAAKLSEVECDFLLSTWHSNEFRKNEAIERDWNHARFNLVTREHFYHVGSSEDLRHPMIEALISNFEIPDTSLRAHPASQASLFALESA